MNAQVHEKECLEKRLVPFYDKNQVSAIFSPDLAPAHYAKCTLDLLKAKGIQFVAKDESPPNALELRSIERYWAIVKRNLIKKCLKAGNIEEFWKNWLAVSKSISQIVVQLPMKSDQKKVRQKLKTKFFFIFL